MTLACLRYVQGLADISQALKSATRDAVCDFPLTLLHPTSSIEMLTFNRTQKVDKL